MLRILLIRHGTTDLTGRVLYGRMEGVHLDVPGRAETECLGSMLHRHYHLDEIVTSPLERTIETTNALLKVVHVPVIVDEGWIELDYGDWMGLSFEEIREMESWNHFNRARSMAVPPRGESMMQVQARAWQALERIFSRWEGKESATVAVVSHGDVIRGLLMLLLGMPLDHIHRFEIAPASLSEIVFEGRYPKVISVNGRPCR